MENLRRLGAEAGVLAGLATAWLFLGLVWAFPEAGLNLADQVNPHKYLPFIGKHQVMFWTVNVVGGLLAALMSAVLFLALGDRFDEEAPASSRIGPLFGIGGAIGFAASALIRQVGFGAAALMYPTNKTVAAQTFYAMLGIENSMFAFGQVAVGLGVIVLGIVMLRTKRYAGVGYLSAVAGTTMFLSGFISHVVLFVASFALMTVWIVWSALIMRTEAGPAFIRWGYTKPQPRTSGRHAV